MTTGADWMDSARKLLDVLRPPDGPAATAPAGEPAHDGGDCRWCPVCQAAGVLRGERPEVTAALADVLATTASVLRDLAGEPDPSGPPPADTAPDTTATSDDGSDGGSDGGTEPGSVQRIDIA